MDTAGPQVCDDMTVAVALSVIDEQCSAPGVLALAH